MFGEITSLKHIDFTLMSRGAGQLVFDGLELGLYKTKTRKRDTFKITMSIPGEIKLNKSVLKILNPLIVSNIKRINGL